MAIVCGVVGGGGGGEVEKTSVSVRVGVAGGRPQGRAVLGLNTSLFTNGHSFYLPQLLFLV